jgi:hypothetical protein
LIGSVASSISPLTVAVGLADALGVGVGVSVGTAAGVEETEGCGEKDVGAADDSAADVDAGTGALMGGAVLWASVDGSQPTKAAAHAATATNLNARKARPRCRQ